MSPARQIFHGGPIFDGERMLNHHRLVIQDGVARAIEPVQNSKDDCQMINLGGDIIAPGFVDLQVNGGDGVMFNDAPTLDTLQRMACAHRSLGATSILPTLITATADKTALAIRAAKQAVAANTPGIAGLHLEGPHLSVARKGAHSAGLIRPMEDADLSMLLDAAAKLPTLMLTIAPENVRTDQVQALAQAGAIVSLGHTDADYATCMAYVDAGARCVTHLFNAMSQLGNRAPGLVGAALQNGALSAGLIADAVHVHPASIRAAWDAKAGPSEIFLVSDAMACAGSDIQSFEIDGRIVLRNQGKLTLQDGTLAGADLDLCSALRVMVQQVGIPLQSALRAVTSVPADLAGVKQGRLIGANVLDMIRITPDISLSPQSPALDKSTTEA